MSVERLRFSQAKSPTAQARITLSMEREQHACSTRLESEKRGVARNRSQTLAIKLLIRIINSN